MAKPGVMFYFDIRPCIKRLDINEKGRLFEAILDYAEFGVVPDLDGSLGIAWDFIQPKLDRDAGRYDRQVEQKQYAVFTREIKKKGGNPITFEEWRSLSEIERNRLLSADTGRYPTPNYNLQPQPQTTTSTNNTIEADKPPSVADADFEKFWSAYPKKVGKQAAKKAFNRVKVPVETLLTAIERQKCSAQWSKDGGQYIPNPVTWLNQGRWDDELEQPQETPSDNSVVEGMRLVTTSEGVIAWVCQD